MDVVGLEVFAVGSVQPSRSFDLIQSGLHELGLLLRSVHYHCSQPIVLADDDRKCLDVSFGASRRLGLTRDEVIACRLDDLATPKFRSQMDSRWRQLLQLGEQADTIPLLLSGGSAREVGYLAKANVLPGQHLMVLRNEVQANALGKQAEGGSVPSWVRDAALLLLDADGKIAAWYAGAERIYGYNSEDAVGQELSFLYEGKDVQTIELRRELARAAAMGRVGSQGWHLTKDGSRFRASVLTIAIKDSGGRLHGFAAILRDFSDRPETSQQSGNGFEPSPRPAPGSLVGVVLGEFDRVIDATDGFLSMVGYSHEELLNGQPYWPNLTPIEYALRDELANEEALIHLACKPFEKEYIRKDGSRLPVLVTRTVLSAHPFRWSAFAQDLTARKEPDVKAAPVLHSSFKEIVGESPPLRQVFEQIELVAPTDATVLILGETGTGKELAARAIHCLSDRCDQPFISLNCAALPAGLLESELFGYEKGAFTGALTRKLGRFEMANGGTLFLDEVGDIPLELQPKLLRALQEKEFERLGGTRTIPIDVRLLAATNRNLTQMMGDQLFRTDLYYRLRVFPIVMPPLRDHPTDIPLLARHFVQKYCDEMKRELKTIPAETMRAMASWSWPGNIRELENFIERSVILSRGTSLSSPLAEIRADAAVHSHNGTLEEVEREHIIHVLKESSGVVSTAATRLGMPRTTLNAMMRKLGITRKNF
jgi:PAS domain S-box-containing protein